jgi:serine phosphatase RsbU (regulator of sigma subunit)
VFAALSLPPLTSAALDELDVRLGGASGALLLTVLVAAILGGRAAGLLATFVALLCDWYWFIEPIHSFEVGERAGVVTLAIFGACGVAVVLIVDLLDEARRRVEDEARRVHELQTIATALAGLEPHDDIELGCAERALNATSAAWVEVARGHDQDVVGWVGRTEEAGDFVVEFDSTIAVTGRERAPLHYRFGFDAPVDDRVHLFAEAITKQCSAALERLLFRRAELLAASEQELLTKAATQLAAAPDTDAVVAAIESLVVPDIADTSAVVLRQGAARQDGAALDSVPTALSVPIVSRAEILGELVLTREDGFDPIRRALATKLAELAGQALDRALLFEEQMTTSLTLQRSLLPTALLPPPGLDIAARYLAVGDNEVGGDFYDAVRHDDGSVTLIIGDVQGKGIPAATLNAVARQTLRAIAAQGRRPAELLRDLNAALLYLQEEQAAGGETAPLRLVTAGVVRLDPIDGGFRATAACGGHLPPIVVRANGDVARIEALGTVLGLLPEPRLRELSVDLALADTIVLYTDGVTDVHNGERFLGEADLARLIRNRLDLTSADAVAEHVTTTVRNVAAAEMRDDIAVLVARVVTARED